MQKLGTPIGVPGIFRLAAAAIVVTATAATVIGSQGIVIAAAAEQNQKDDDPAPVTTAEIVIAHKNTSEFDVCGNAAHSKIFPFAKCVTIILF